MPCPPGPLPARPLRRMRGRRLHRDSRGVAAVIGTLLALLVFMTLFGIFLTQFLPLWMTDNEASFANNVATEMGQIKQCEDLLALYNQQGRGCSTPIQMQSGSIPVFASPTQATLAFQTIPNLYANVTYNDTVIGAPRPHGNVYQNYSPAEISMSLPNRYYTPVTYVLTEGALFQDQGGNQQTMLYQPSVAATVAGLNVNLAITLYYMYGNATRLESTGSNEVYVTYIGSQAETVSASAVNMTFSTYYPCAWANYLGTVLKGSGISPQFRPANCPNVPTFGQLYQVESYFPPSTTFTFTMCYFTITMGLENPG